MYPLWNFFLTRRAFTILTIGALLASGVYALFAMPKESTPEIVIPMGIVTTVLPGATAADVERLVTAQLDLKPSGNARTPRTSAGGPGAYRVGSGACLARWGPSCETIVNSCRQEHLPTSLA